MTDAVREYPLFSACGLNCGLCPRFHTDGKSRCPGCGGEGFYSNRPTCGIISCTKRHGVDFCFQCGEYPCPRYARENDSDSFITYQRVKEDFALAKAQGLDAYRAALEEKVAILTRLLTQHNDGRRKSFYCTAVNLLPLDDLRDAMQQLEAATSPDAPPKERAQQAVQLLQSMGDSRGLTLALRSKKKKATECGG